MPIGLNYSPIDTWNWTQILPNYMFCLDNELWADDWVFPLGAVEKIKKIIQEWILLEFLEKESSNERFDDPILREILLASYPYEITNKFLWWDEQNDFSRNENIITLFNTFFGIDFTHEVESFAERDPVTVAWIMSRSSVLHQETYTNRDDAVAAYFLWVDKLLKKQGFTEEAAELELFYKNNMVVRYREWISWVAFSDGDTIVIEVWNNSYVTLFHEITHFVAKFFRFTYYEDDEVCFDNYTKTNEWLANYVAYHLFDGITCGDKNCIENIAHEELFFSPYIAVYALLRKQWSNDKQHNFALVKNFMEWYEWSMLTEEKARFYFERFYKFFDYKQHDFFYPKELMYYIWYNTIREMMKESNNPTQLLTQLLLWKICL